MDSQCNPNACMFFKIILHTTIAQAKLEIPAKFVSKYANRLRSPVIFKTPNGNSWEIELSNAGEALWFDKGWKEFAEHYSLKHGHLLVFSFEPDSRFNVNIFDMSAVEIEYSRSQSTINSSIKEQQLKPQSIDENSLLQFGGNLTSSSEVAGVHSPSNPWFEVVIKPHHLKQHYLTVPYRFFTMHMQGQGQNKMLKFEDKSWPVKLHEYPHSKTAGLYGGIRSFLKENSLKKGDSCVFVMNNNNFNVSISRI